jgi:hypothetical protein
VWCAWWARTAVNLVKSNESADCDERHQAFATTMEMEMERGQVSSCHLVDRKRRVNVPAPRLQTTNDVPHMYSYARPLYCY